MYQEFLKIAVKEAQKSNMKHKYGAVLVYRGKIISRGHNLRVFPTWIKRNARFSLHAEQMCINRCREKKFLNKATLFLVRIQIQESDYAIISSFPCKKCAHIINKYAIRKLYVFT